MTLLYSWFLCILFATLSYAAIPDYVKVCRLSEENYIQCVRDSIESIRPYVIKGIPEFNVPPLEPLMVPDMNIQRTEDNLKIRIAITNCMAHGGSNFRIDYLTLDTEGLSGAVVITLPQLNVVANYELEARLNLLPIIGKGLFYGNFSEIKVDISGQGKRDNIDGKEVFQIDQIKSKIKFGDARIKIVNPDLPDAIREAIELFFNQNRKELMKLLSPLIQEQLNNAIVEHGNKIFQTMTVDEILPQRRR